MGPEVPTGSAGFTGAGHIQPADRHLRAGLKGPGLQACRVRSTEGGRLEEPLILIVGGGNRLPSFHL